MIGTAIRITKFAYIGIAEKALDSTLASKPVTGIKDIDGAKNTFDQYDEMAEVPKNLKYTTHTVVKNESWGLIFKKYGCGASGLAKVNNKMVFDVIHPGDVLKVLQQ